MRDSVRGRDEERERESEPARKMEIERVSKKR